MLGLAKLINFRREKQSLSFNFLATSVLGLSLGLGLVGTHSASAKDSPLETK